MKPLRSLIVLAAVLLLAAPAWAQHPGALIAVHGIDGRDLGLGQNLPVDVAVDGACALTSFKFGETTDPIPLPRGTYDVEISLSDGACGGTVVIAAKVRLAPNQVKALIANLDTAGAPTGTLVQISNRELRDDYGRIVVVHAANAPQVDVTLNRGGRKNEGVVTTLKNGQAGSADLSDGRWVARIFPYLAETKVAGPVRLPIESNQILIVYAVGTFPDTFGLVAQSFAAGPIE